MDQVLGSTPQPGAQSDREYVALFEVALLEHSPLSRLRCLGRSLDSGQATQRSQSRTDKNRLRRPLAHARYVKLERGLILTTAICGG